MNRLLVLGVAGAGADAGAGAGAGARVGRLAASVDATRRTQ